MSYAITDDLKPGNNPEYPHAPQGWSERDALELAQQEGIELGAEHRVLIRSLQEYYFKHSDSAIKVRELTDALEEAFHREGGMKFLYTLLPAGPIAQGCRLAGLSAPAGAVDKSFGSVQ
ncbi:MAG: TusE/DsrC/DsvC family sulfur relay protein [Gammaproteobacteria bacterium]|nr:TusE/DsrC/DsvC family sulfur relay protein [Gammaproteobacteria bacterium]